MRLAGPVRTVVAGALHRRRERRERILHQGLMTDIGKKAGFDLNPAFAADMTQNLAAQFGNAFAGKSRNTNRRRLPTGH